MLDRPDWKYSRFVCVFVFLFSFGVGCGPDSSSDSQKTSGKMTPEKFMQEVRQVSARAECRKIFECPSSYEVDVRGLLLFKNSGSIETCTEQLRSVSGLPYNIRDRINGLSQGRAEYSEERARSCLQNFRQRVENIDPCHWDREKLDPLETCDGLVNPTLAEDDQCTTDIACRSGECIPESGQCYGTCAPSSDDEEGSTVGEGENCDRNDCEVGLTCQTSKDSDESVCVPIGSRSEGEACSDDEACGQGLCKREGRSGTCAPLEFKGEGDSCEVSSFSWCEPGLTCSVEGFTGEEIEGETAQWGSCVPTASEGESCWLTRECAAKLYCDGAELGEEPSQGTCRPPKAAGSSCEFSYQCKGTLRCSSDTQKCTDPQTCSLPN